LRDGRSDYNGVTRQVLKSIVQACLLAVLVWAYPAGYSHANTVRDPISQIEFYVYDFGPKYPHGPFQSDYTPPPKPVVKQISNPSIYCSCVLTVKAWTGYSTPVGFARNWPKNTDTPVVGGVVITNEGWAGHVAYIMEVTTETITVKEGNFRRCALSTRIIPLTSPVILGYWSVPES